VKPGPDLDSPSGLFGRAGLENLGAGTGNWAVDFSFSVGVSMSSSWDNVGYRDVDMLVRSGIVVDRLDCVGGLGGG